MYDVRYNTHAHTAELGLGGARGKKSAEAIGLAAAEEYRTFCVLQSTQVFNKWKEE